MITPSNQEAPSICGPVYGVQSVPSFYNQVTRFPGGCGSKLDHSVAVMSYDGSLRAIGRQAPVAWGIDLRGGCSFPAAHIEPERFRGVSLPHAVQADRRWQARTLHVPDAEVLEDQARRSATYGNGENRRGSLRTGRLGSGNI